eukprot:maker-scaffold_6-snap-gene-19.52-mRNA-1 protein AED:0.33 eAED:0.33 QI:121/1/1/1/1/1/5/25/224
MGKRKKEPSFPNPFKNTRFLMALFIFAFKAFVDLDDEGTFQLVSLACSLVFFLLIATQGFIYYQSKFGSSKRETTFYLTKSQLHPDEYGLDPLTKEKKFQITFAEYDVVRFWDQFQKLSIALTVGLGVYLYWSAVTPLVFMAISQPMTLYTNPLFQIHVLGKDAVDDRKLKRPWKTATMPIPFGKDGYLGQQLQRAKAESEGLNYDEITQKKKGNRKSRRAKKN